MTTLFPQSSLAVAGLLLTGWIHPAPGALLADFEAYGLLSQPPGFYRVASDPAPGQAELATLRVVSQDLLGATGNQALEYNRGESGNRPFLTYFPAVDFAPGSTVTLTFDFLYTGGTAATSALRFGLFDTNGLTRMTEDGYFGNPGPAYRGYVARGPVASSTWLAGVRKELNADNALTSGSDLVTLASDVTSATTLALNTVYRTNLTLINQGGTVAGSLSYLDANGQTLLSASFSGDTGPGGVVPSQFDGFALQITNSTTLFLDNLQVVPEPAAGAGLAGILASLLVLGLRRS